MGPAAKDTSPSLRVRLFAALREQAGWSERIWPLAAAEVTPRLIWQQLQLSPPGDPWPAGLRIAVNQEFAAADQPLHPGDEVAFLPPISGG